MINSLMNIFVLYLGNWQFLASMMVLYLLLLRTFSKKNYLRFWNSIRFINSWKILALNGVIFLLLREILLYPLPRVQSWMPGSYFWEQFLMFIFTCHIQSIALYSCLIFYLWKKYDSFLPALYVGFFGISFIEFTFIPQHFITWNMFLGAWYYPFAIAIIPFLIERKSWSFPRIKRMLVFIGIGIAMEYLILLYLPYSLSSFIPGTMAWKLNDAVMPHPPIQTWIFMGSNILLKIFMLIGISMIERKKENEL